MRVIEQRGGYPEAQEGEYNGTALALGYFDGVHRGHQAVLNAALAAAASQGLDAAVFTFSPADGLRLKGSAICTEEQKHRVLAEMGIRFCFEPPFESFRTLSPEDFFYEMLLGAYRARALFCGENYGFGAKRAGDTALLRRLCDENGVSLTVVPTTLWQGEPVSSSRIRAALAAGDVAAAGGMLGRPYEIDFRVRHGQGLGHTLGFPTLNQVFPAGLQPPKTGVYITETLLEGQAWPSATGFGTRPTVNDDPAALTCETFIPGFTGDLYGERVRVQFHKRIADTQKFASPEALAQAVQNWAEQATAYFAKKP